MKKNMSALDSAIRLVIAILFFMLYVERTATGIFGIILLALGGIFIVTSLFGFCPIYALLRMRTLKADGN